MLRQVLLSVALLVTPVLLIVIWFVFDSFGDWRDQQEATIVELQADVSSLREDVVSLEEKLARDLNAFSTVLLEHGHPTGGREGRSDEEINELLDILLDGAYWTAQMMETLLEDYDRRNEEAIRR